LRRHPERPHGQKEFQDAPLGWRFLTLFAGPMMNFIYALVMFIAIYSIVGTPDPQRTNRIDEVISGDPAATAGIQSGDRLVGVNGTRTSDPEQLSKLISASGGKPIVVAIEHAGQIINKTVQPTYKELPKLDGSGTEKVPAIGISFALDAKRFQKVGLDKAIILGWTNSTGIARDILGMLKRALMGRLSKDEARSIGGPVKIAQAVGETARLGWQYSALLSAALSVNLGLINLLPLPALDGGRILFLGYELVFSRPLDSRKEGLVHAVGMVMLLAFMLFITVHDVGPWLSQHFGKLF